MKGRNTVSLLGIIGLPLSQHLDNFPPAFLAVHRRCYEVWCRRSNTVKVLTWTAQQDAIHETFSYKRQLSETINLFRVKLGSNPKNCNYQFQKYQICCFARHVNMAGQRALVMSLAVLVQQAMKVPRELCVAA